MSPSQDTAHRKSTATEPRKIQRLLIANRGETRYDHLADVLLDGDLSELLPELLA